MTGLLSDLDRGVVERVVFALPGGVTWPLPLYELALLTADHLARQEHRGEADVRDAGERSALALLGTEASKAGDRAPGRAAASSW